MNERPPPLADYHWGNYHWGNPLAFVDHLVYFAERVVRTLIAQVRCSCLHLQGQEQPEGEPALLHDLDL